MELRVFSCMALHSARNPLYHKPGYDVFIYVYVFLNEEIEKKIHTFVFLHITIVPSGDKHLKNHTLPCGFGIHIFVSLFVCFWKLSYEFALIFKCRHKKNGLIKFKFAFLHIYQFVVEDVIPVRQNY